MAGDSSIVPRANEGGKLLGSTGQAWSTARARPRWKETLFADSVQRRCQRSRKGSGAGRSRKKLEPDLYACAARRGLEMAQVYE